MSAFLTLKNFFPLGADSVEAALKILGAEHIDAIVMDVRLPDPTGLHGSGLNLLTFLRATTEYASTPVIVLAGMPLSCSEQDFVRTHNGHVLSKSESYSVLFEYLISLIEPSGSP